MGDTINREMGDTINREMGDTINRHQPAVILAAHCNLAQPALFQATRGECTQISISPLQARIGRWSICALSV